MTGAIRRPVTSGLSLPPFLPIYSRPLADQARVLRPLCILEPGNHHEPAQLRAQVGLGTAEPPLGDAYI